MNMVEQNKNSVIALCEEHHVKQLYVFGSILSDRFNEKSDVDFLINFDQIKPESYFDNFMDLKENLESLLQRQVDFVEDQAIKNPVFRKVVDREKVLIYERKNTKIPLRH